MRALMEDNHEDERGRRRLLEQAQALGDELVAAGVLEWLPEPDADGRTLRLAVELQDDFALNQPLASFALVAFELLDPESETHALDVALGRRGDPRRPVAGAHGPGATRRAARPSPQMKADGIEYEERMELLEEVTYPQPLAEPLRDALHAYRETHPWVRESDLSPKSVVRDMYEQGRTFTEFVALLRPRPLGGPRAALPQRRLPRAAPDGARAGARPTSSTRSSSGSARRSARPTRACSTSGRR